MLDFLSMFQMAGVVSVHLIAFSYFVKEPKIPSCCSCLLTWTNSFPKLGLLLKKLFCS